MSVYLRPPRQVRLNRIILKGKTRFSAAWDHNITQVKLNLSGFMINRGPQEYTVVQPLVRIGEYVRPVQAIVVDQIPFFLNIKGLGYTSNFLQNNGIELADNQSISDRLTSVNLLVGAD